MSTKSRAELFEKAKQAHKADKIAEDQKKSGDFQFDPINYDPLTPKGYRQVRVLGLPIHVKEDDPTSPAYVNISFIKGDNGSKFRCIWPSRDDAPNWILRKVYNTVMAYTWNGEKRVKEFHHEQNHPELVARCKHNNSPNNPYEQGWYPKTSVVMNVISRHRMDWHREHKKSLLISSKASENSEKPGEYFYTAGVPRTVYDGIMEGPVAFSGDWEQYDVVIQKLDDKPWYEVYHAAKDSHRFANDFPQFSEFQQYAEAPLTEEELSWERYDIGSIFKPTKYKKIQDMLGGFIKEVDVEFGKNFTEELNELVAEEQAEVSRRKAEKQKEESTTVQGTDVPNPNTNVPNPSTEESARPARASRQTQEETAKPMTEGQQIAKAVREKDYDALVGFGFAGIPKLSEEEREAIIGYDIDDKEFTYSDAFGAILECPDDHFPSPEKFSHCPKCGEKF